MKKLSLLAENLNGSRYCSFTRDLKKSEKTKSFGEKMFLG